MQNNLPRSLAPRAEATAKSRRPLRITDSAIQMLAFATGSSTAAVSTANYNNSATAASTDHSLSVIANITTAAAAAGVATAVAASNAVENSDIMRSPTYSHATAVRNIRKITAAEQNRQEAIMLQNLRLRMRPGLTIIPASSVLDQTSDLPDSPLTVAKNYLIAVPGRNYLNSRYRNAPTLRQPLRCTDIFTQQQFLCRIVNEPFDKVQCAYTKLQQTDDELRLSQLFGHALVRPALDIVGANARRTFVILSKPEERGMQPFEEGTPTLPADFGGSGGEWTFAHAPTASSAPGSDKDLIVYEDLHTYIRNKRRLCEREARNLFHQIAQTVLLCHSNGIIMRDLKLKRFYFIDEARTKLQYESLEGSMILDDPENDMLSDKIGCPLYTAPELLCPTPTYRGKPADMWALGVILYTMLVGQYPFYERLNCNLIAIIRHGHVHFPSSMSRAARMLILQLLQKNLENRLSANFIFGSSWMRLCRPCYAISVNSCFEDEEEEHKNIAETAVEQSNVGEAACADSARVTIVGADDIAPMSSNAMELEQQQDCVLEGSDAAATTGHNAVVSAVPSMAKILQQSNAELQQLRTRIAEEASNKNA